MGLAAAAVPQELLSQDLVAFEVLLRRLLSPKNEERGGAEQIFSALKQQHPDILALKLVACLQPAHSPEVRTISAVLFRRVITKDQVSLWASLSPGAQAQVKSDLLSVLRAETQKSIWRKICDTVAELAADIVEGGSWPELLPILLSWLTASAPGGGGGTDEWRCREIALLIFAQAVHFLQEPLRPHMGALHTALLQCLAPSCPPDVRLAALRAAVNLVEAVESAEEVAQLQGMLPPMVQVLSLALGANDEAGAQEALELLVEVAEYEPRFLRKHLGEVLPGMLHIAESASLEAATRHLAVEFLVSLAEARERAPGMFRKAGGQPLLARLFAVLLAMLADVEDVPEWHAAEEEGEEDAGEGEDFGVAQEALDRLAMAMGGNMLLPVASQALPVYAADADWRKRHAAFICLSQIAEGCSKLMLKNLPAVASVLLGGFPDPVPRVRWAAVNAVGQLCTDLGPELQEKYHQQLVPALLGAMDDANNPRVQAHATSALLNFSEGASAQLLAPYMDALLSKLLLLIQHPRRIVQEGALTAVAAVADCAQEHFVRYYDAVMPYLKAILTGATRREQRLLRAKSIECISLVGMAVGKEKFREDALQVMQILTALQQQHQQQQQQREQQQQQQQQGQGLDGAKVASDSDDPVMSYMLQAWARICKCLGQEFLPFLGVVMPPLLESASLKPDVTITDVDEDGADHEHEDEDEDEGVETIVLGDKKIGIRTSMLEEKGTACSMLCCYAQELKEGFLPYIDQVAQLMVPLLKFYFDGDVRKSAAQTLPELLRGAKAAVEKGLTPPTRPLPGGGQQGYVKGLVDSMVPPLVELLPKEPEEQVCVVMLESLQECIEVAGRELDSEQVGAVLRQLGEVQRASNERRQDRAKRAKAEDFDEEEMEMLEEDNDAEDEILDGIGECIGELMRVFKSDFDAFFQALSPSVLAMMGKKQCTTERRVGICIFDDAAENLGEAAWKYYSAFVPLLLDACHDPAPEIRQAAAYGIGQCAQHGGSTFTPYANDAVSRLVALASAPDSRSEESAGATDNAVSSLGKLCEYQAAAGFDTARVLAAWLQYLPLREDKAEAKAVHAHLLHLLHRSDARILGPSNQNLPRIATIILEILAAGDDLATEETRQQATAVLRSIPPPALAGVPQEHHALLQSLLSSG